MSPSAFIPFCDFGGNMLGMGVKIDKFDVPVCNAFQEKILNDQLCYEVDLKRFSREDNIKRELKLGLNLLLDYNEDRQVNSEEVDDTVGSGLYNRRMIAQNKEGQHANIYLNTIGE